MVTLNCLKQLTAFDQPQWHIIIVDDGSTDGSSEAIRKDFPHVTILEGDGNLFWTGAIELGMRHAIASGADCCVWINDDMTLKAESINTLVDFSIENNALVSAQGTIVREDLGIWFFPALIKDSKGLTYQEINPLSKIPYISDTTRGNLVAIPKSVIDQVGYPDGKNIPHVGGDSDYGLRVTAAQLRCYTLPAITFMEDENIRDDNRSWLLGTRPVRKIIKASLGKRGNLYPRMVLTYNIRHWGIIRGGANAIRSFASLFVSCSLRCLLPRFLLVKLFANHSHAYKAYASHDALLELDSSTK